MMWNLNDYKDNIALIDENNERITYDKLEKECAYIAQVVDGRALVFNLCNKSIGAILGYVSFLNSCIVPVMLSANLEEQLLENLLNIYKPEYLWLPEWKIVKHKKWKLVHNCFEYCLIKTNYNKGYLLNDDLALLLTTSGSTGSPKFVRQSYKNIKANTESIVEYLGLDSSERPITTLPLNYTYGLSIINTHLAVGATILLTDKGLMQKEFWSFFKEYEATSFGGPYTYEMLDKLRFYRMNLPSVRTMTQSGGKLTPELHERFAKYADENNKKFIVIYGQCEATARMGYLPANMAIAKKVRWVLQFLVVGSVLLMRQERRFRIRIS